MESQLHFIAFLRVYTTRMSKLVQHAHPEYRLSWVLNILQPCLEHFTAMLGTFYSHVWNILQPCLEHSQPCLEHFTAMFGTFYSHVYPGCVCTNIVIKHSADGIFTTNIYDLQTS